MIRNEYVFEVWEWGDKSLLRTMPETKCIVACVNEWEEGSCYSYTWDLMKIIVLSTDGKVTYIYYEEWHREC